MKRHPLSEGGRDVPSPFTITTAGHGWRDVSGAGTASRTTKIRDGAIPPCFQSPLVHPGSRVLLLLSGRSPGLRRRPQRDVNRFPRSSSCIKGSSLISESPSAGQYREPVGRHSRSPGCNPGRAGDARRCPPMSAADRHTRHAHRRRPSADFLPLHPGLAPWATRMPPYGLVSKL